MPKLIFRGASIRFVDLRYDDKSKTVYTKINLTAAFTEPIREAMQWGTPPAGFASAKLDGEFTASNFILTPNGRELKQHELQMNAKEIGSFDLIRVKGDDGESARNELRFQLLTADPLASGLLAQYLAAIGKGEAQLRVNYEQQGELEMAAEDQQERLISEEQAADTEEAEDGPALAPATLMGGTHQKSRRKQPREIN